MQHWQQQATLQASAAVISALTSSTNPKISKREAIAILPCNMKNTTLLKQNVFIIYYPMLYHFEYTGSYVYMGTPNKTTCMYCTFSCHMIYFLIFNSLTKININRFCVFNKPLDPLTIFF